MSESTSFKLLRFSYGKAEKVYELLPDRIPYMDLTCCLSGRMLYVYEGKEYELNDGDAILFPKGTVRARKETDKETVYSSFNVSYDGFVPKACGYLPNTLGVDTVMVLGLAFLCLDYKESIGVGHRHRNGTGILGKGAGLQAADVGQVVLWEPFNNSCTTSFFILYVSFFRSAQRATLSGPDRNKLLPALAKNNKLLLFS